MLAGPHPGGGSRLSELIAYLVGIVLMPFITIFGDAWPWVAGAILPIIFWMLLMRAVAGQVGENK